MEEGRVKDLFGMYVLFFSCDESGGFKPSAEIIEASKKVFIANATNLNIL